MFLLKTLADLLFLGLATLLIYRVMICILIKSMKLTLKIVSVNSINDMLFCYDYLCCKSGKCYGGHMASRLAARQNNTGIFEFEKFQHIPFSSYYCT